MSSIGLNTGLKALLSARYMLDTIGHNIANANTPGYSRQRVQLGTALGEHDALGIAGMVRAALGRAQAAADASEAPAEAAAPMPLAPEEPKAIPIGNAREPRT